MSDGTSWPRSSDKMAPIIRPGRRRNGGGNGLEMWNRSRVSLHSSSLLFFDFIFSTPQSVFFRKIFYNQRTITKGPCILNSIQEVSFFVMPIVILLALSAFFSGSETALFSLTPDAARRLRHHRRIEELLSILRHEPSDLLSSILFGNLIVNILFFCTGATAAGRWGAARGEWFEALGGALVLISLILFGEIVPKAIGINHSAGVLRLAAIPLRFWFGITRFFSKALHRALHFLRLLDRSPAAESCLTPGELRELLDAVHHEPGFGSQEKEMLEDIVNLSDIRVREIMVPRVKVFRRSLLASRQEILETCRKNEYSQVLIYRDKDDIPLGYINSSDLFFDKNAARSLESLIHPLVYVPETKRVDRLLREFMANGWRLVAVVDEYGGLSGIVTLEDLFEEVIGDFEPEVTEEIVRLDETTYRLQGQLSIREWRELFTGFLPGQDMETLAFDTLGGLIISLLGRMPRAGDEVNVRNLHLIVESVRGRRIEKVLLHLNGREVKS